MFLPGTLTLTYLMTAPFLKAFLYLALRPACLSPTFLLLLHLTDSDVWESSGLHQLLLKLLPGELIQPQGFKYLRYNNDSYMFISCPNFSPELDTHVSQLPTLHLHLEVQLDLLCVEFESS